MKEQEIFLVRIRVDRHSLIYADIKYSLLKNCEVITMQFRQMTVLYS